MTKIFLFLFSVLLFLSCKKSDTGSYDILISNVKIVDVESGKVTTGKLILIEGDTIRRIVDEEEINNFVAKETLDAGGGFLMPGLWDMHVHFRGGDTLISENKELLPLFLAYGITSIRDAGGDITPALLEWRDQITQGDLDGPRIFTPGPKLDGTNPAWPGSIKVTTQEEIETALDSLESLGVDYVKMYDGNLTKEAFYEIIKAAEKRGLKTTGHMPLTADFLDAVEYGLDGSEHMYYPLKACSPISDSLTALNRGYGIVEQLIDSYDPELADMVFKEMSAKNVFVTPTLYIGTTLAEILEKDHSRDSLLNYVGPGIQETYKGRIEGAKRAQASGSEMRQKMEAISARMIRPMYDAGVPILAGSDCGAFNSYVYPGESLLGELKSLVGAGLTPREALETSVINGPKFFDLLDYFGTVGQGKVAHLILLDENPLEDLANLGNPAAVIKSGKVYTREKLSALM
ncbi:MAG TPA: amidohydrolase family protein, partial [Gillisia sp.]|nr:amidohydrolase family protein [Gillisia sp.]